MGQSFRRFEPTKYKAREARRRPTLQGLSALCPDTLFFLPSDHRVRRPQLFYKRPLRRKEFTRCHLLPRPVPGGHRYIISSEWCRHQPLESILIDRDRTGRFVPRRRYFHRCDFGACFIHPLAQPVPCHPRIRFGDKGIDEFIAGLGHPFLRHQGIAPEAVRHFAVWVDFDRLLQTRS